MTKKKPEPSKGMKKAAPVGRLSWQAKLRGKTVDEFAPAPALVYFLVYGFSRMQACSKVRPPTHRQTFVLIGGEQDSIELELGQVLIEPSVNTRQVKPSDAEIDALAASIKAHGLLEPTAVMLGPLDPVKFAKARRLNLIENVRRTDLAPWEIADALYQDKLAGSTVDQLETSTGLSIPHIYNLIRMREKLAPELWEILQRAGRSAVLKDFIELSAKGHAEQLEEWQKKTSGGAKPPPGKASPRPRARSLLRALPEGPKEVEPRLESPEWAAGARFALRAIAGEVLWSPSAR